jgi:hypothetical protein
VTVRLGPSSASRVQAGGKGRAQSCRSIRQSESGQAQEPSCRGESPSPAPTSLCDVGETFSKFPPAIMAVVRWRGMKAIAQLFVLAIILEVSNCLYDIESSKVIMLDEKVRQYLFM